MTNTHSKVFIRGDEGEKEHEKKKGKKTKDGPLQKGTGSKKKVRSFLLYVRGS